MLSDYKVILSNLKRNDRFFDEITDIRAAHISECARVVAGYFSSGAYFFANTEFLSEFRRAENILFGNTGEYSGISENGELSGLLKKQISYCEKAFFAICIFNEIEKSRKIRLEAFFDAVDEPARPLCAGFVENMRTEQAFTQLSAVKPRIEKCLCRNFDEAFDNVSSNELEYCLIPIKNNIDGELVNLKRLISDYGLKKCAVTYVTSPDDRITEYALLSSAIRSFFHHGNDRMFLEFTTSFEHTEDIAQISALARLFDTEINSIKSVDASLDGIPYGNFTQNKTNRYLISATVKKENLVRVLFCLCLDFPSFTINGLYNII